MRALGSVIMAAADAHRVPAGSALAVDRDGFSTAVTELWRAIPMSTSSGNASTSSPLPADDRRHRPAHRRAPCGVDRRRDRLGRARLFRRDCSDRPPRQHRHGVCWMASRWDKGETKDYINCPMTREQYAAFHQGLLDGEKTEFREWEKDTPYFDGCMPIEVMAERGLDTLRFGPMKPVGLDDPRTGRWPHAGVQLRRTMRSAPCGTWSASRPS
jgi:methylenetetrahydrofolate--tRNA-(uracil-5-)-methyltransferase